MLSGRGLCAGLITHPEESYRLWCVSVCDLENLVNDVALAQWGGAGGFRAKTNKQCMISAPRARAMLIVRS